MNLIRLKFFVATALCCRAFFVALLTGFLLTFWAGMPAWAEQPPPTLYEQWAAYFGLSGNDARENADPDADGRVNEFEYTANLDPTSQDSDGDFLGDGAESNALSRVNLKLGDPRFSRADGLFVYPVPPWCLGSRQVSGAWITNAPLDGRSTNAWFVASTVAAGTGAVEVAIDRALVTTNDLECRVVFNDLAGTHLILELAEIGGATVAEDLHGNLATGSGALRSVTVNVPLSDYPAAGIVRLRRLSGETTIYALQLFSDFDADGLDDAAEQEFGSDPSRPDTDNDGLADFDEVVRHKTNPAAADTDGDGISDSEELRIGMDPLRDDRSEDLDGDGVNNITEYLMGRSVNVAGMVGDTNAQVRLTLFLPLAQREP